jgi:diguanylate cyclase (GGDEF)-like protein/PAS domain S-box-containing protein
MLPRGAVSKLGSRKTGPGLVVGIFVLLMSACVILASIFKVVHERSVELERSRIDVQNLAHSLSEHVSNTIQAPDIAMRGMADSLRYQNPLPERFNKYLADTVAALPQIRELGALDTDGNWRFSSLAETPKHNNSDRSYFIFHRDTPGNDLRISEPFQSRLTGRLTVLLTRRITKADGSFGGVLFAAIDSEYFSNFYSTFQLGKDSGITLVRLDGIVLMRTPTFHPGADISNTELFRTFLPESPIGFHRTTSVFDGVVKYFGYEKVPQYPLLVTVAVSEETALAKWWSMLGADALITGVQLGVVILLAAMLSLQFRRRLRTEATLRQREAYFRLLTENIADVVILLDPRGNLRYVSHSVEMMLGRRPQDLIGKSCFDLVHPADKEAVREAATQSAGPLGVHTTFRTFHADGSVVWVEINFRLATVHIESESRGFVGVLRDVTERKSMEDELTRLNGRLAQLATTDGLTGLANRRTFDGFLRRAYESDEQIAVILFDIDHFKGFNDAYGHQAGDRCLQSVAVVLEEATRNTRGLSARYGGEEFVVVLPGVAEEGAMKVAEAIRLAIRALAIPNSACKRGYVTVSGGLASKLPSTLDDASLVGEADVALYEAKRIGRNRIVSRAVMDVTLHRSPLLQPGLAHDQSIEESSR